LQKILIFSDSCGTIVLTIQFTLTLGVIRMSIIAGILVCAFVYVIRESLMGSPEEDWES